VCWLWIEVDDSVFRSRIARRQRVDGVVRLTHATLLISDCENHAARQGACARF